MPSNAKQYHAIQGNMTYGQFVEACPYSWDVVVSAVVLAMFPNVSYLCNRSCQWLYWLGFIQKAPSLFFVHNMKFILLHIWFTVNPNQVWLWDRIFFPRSVRVDCFEDGKTQPGHNGHHCSQILNHFLTLPEPWDLLNTGSWVTNNCIITGYNNRAHWKLGEVILNFTLWCLFLFTSHSSPESHRREGSFLSQCTCKKCTQCTSPLARFAHVDARKSYHGGAKKSPTMLNAFHSLSPSV